MMILKCKFYKILARMFFERGIQAELGLIKTKKRDDARRYYRQAAVLGNRQAQVFLAYYYAADLGVHSNHQLAIAWFKRAAQAGEELCTLVSPESTLDIDEQIQRFKTLISP